MTSISIPLLVQVGAVTVCAFALTLDEFVMMHAYDKTKEITFVFDPEKRKFFLEHCEKRTNFSREIFLASDINSRSWNDLSPFLQDCESKWLERAYEHYLLENAKLPKTLYHGSRNKIEDGWFQPRPSKVIDGEKAVFATNTKWMALAFASGLTHSQIDLGVAQGIPYMAEMYPGAFDLLKIPGYLYTVNSEGFESDPRLGMQGHEFIHRKPVRILQTEFIPNLLEALQKDHVVRLIPDRERVAFFVEHKIPEN
jgi:hypothetical protein